MAIFACLEEVWKNPYFLNSLGRFFRLPIKESPLRNDFRVILKWFRNHISKEGFEKRKEIFLFCTATTLSWIMRCRFFVNHVADDECLVLAIAEKVGFL